MLEPLSSTCLTIPANLASSLKTPVRVITKLYSLQTAQISDPGPSAKLYRDEIVYCPLECNVSPHRSKLGPNLTNFPPLP